MIAIIQRFASNPLFFSFVQLCHFHVPIEPISPKTFPALLSCSLAACVPQLNVMYVDIHSNNEKV
jgi:hypothetical protein